MTAFSLRLTNGANAVSQAPRRHRQRHLARRPEATSSRSPTASTRRPGSAARSASSRALPRRRPRRPRQRHRGRAAGGSGIDRIPAAELWEAHLRQKRELAIFARGRLRTQFARHGEAPRALQELGRRSTRRPDDRLRPPVRDLQARRDDLHRHRAPGPRPLERRGAAGPARLRRQGPSRRPARPGGDPGHLRADPLAGVPRAASSSSRTTTCGSGGSWSRASTSGSTTRAARSRPRARRG